PGGVSAPVPGAGGHASSDVRGAGVEARHGVGAHLDVAAGAGADSRCAQAAPARGGDAEAEAGRVPARGRAGGRARREGEAGAPGRRGERQRAGGCVAGGAAMRRSRAVQWLVVCGTMVMCSGCFDLVQEIWLEAGGGGRLRLEISLPKTLLGLGRMAGEDLLV